MIPLQKQIKKIVEKIILEDNKKKYYVGKIILDTANINPVTYLSFGTWKLWGSGRVPVGVDVDDTESGIYVRAIDPESSRINKIFGATRTPDANGSAGICTVTAAFTGNANSVAKNAAGVAHHGLRWRNARASLRSE